MVQRVALPAPEHIQKLGRRQAVLLVLKKAEYNFQHWLWECLMRQLLGGPLQHKTVIQGASLMLRSSCIYGHAPSSAHRADSP